MTSWHVARTSRASASGCAQACPGAQRAAGSGRCPRSTVTIGGPWSEIDECSIVNVHSDILAFLVISAISQRPVSFSNFCEIFTPTFGRNRQTDMCFCLNYEFVHGLPLSHPLPFAADGRHSHSMPLPSASSPLHSTRCFFFFRSGTAPVHVQPLSKIHHQVKRTGSPCACDLVRKYAKVTTNLTRHEAREVDELCEVCMEFSKQNALPCCCGGPGRAVGLPLQLRWHTLAHKNIHQLSIPDGPKARREVVIAEEFLVQQGFLRCSGPLGDTKTVVLLNEG